jgi:ribonuclease BN (tRNA processing enzyme)
MAADTDLLVAEASYAGQVPGDPSRYATSARQAGQQARDAGAGHLILTYLLPGPTHTLQEPPEREPIRLADQHRHARLVDCVAAYRLRRLG